MLLTPEPGTLTGRWTLAAGPQLAPSGTPATKLTISHSLFRVVPVSTAGCYVPGGLYGYTVSAVMTAGVARAAGVPNIICSAPTNKKTGKIHPNTLYAMKKAGATQILALGGVQVREVLFPPVILQKI